MLLMLLGEDCIVYVVDARVSDGGVGLALDFKINSILFDFGYETGGRAGILITPPTRPSQTCNSFPDEI